MGTTSGLSSAVQGHRRSGSTGFLCAPVRSVRRWAAVFGLAFVFLPAAAAQASDSSDPSVARQETATTPDAPRDLVATTEDGGIVLHWSAPADNGGSNILRYQMRNAEGASVPAGRPWISTGTATTGAFRRLTNGTLYSFEVRAVNAQGDGPAAQIQATPGFPPSAPQNLTATASHGAVRLDWEAPAAPGSTAITDYEYRYAEGATVPSETAWQSNGRHPSILVGNLTNGTAYAFEVRAANAVGAGAAATATATPVRHPKVTARPEKAAYSFVEGASGTGVAIVAEVESGGGRPSLALPVSVSTKEVSAGAESPADYAALSIMVLIEPEDFSEVGGIWQARKTVALSIVDDTLDEDDENLTVKLEPSPGFPTWARLREADGTTVCGVDGCLMTVTIGDNDSAPSAPQNLSATPEDGAVTLAWEAPADSGTSAISEYEYRHAEGESVPEKRDWTSAGTDLTVTVGSLTEGTTYAFEVRAVSDAGGGQPASATAGPLTVPAVPQDILVTTEDGGIVLRWSAPADNGGSNILRYQMRNAEGASVSAGRPWISTGTATTGAFRQLTNGTLYSFEVRAVNAQGDGPAAEIQATPGLPPSAPQSLTATAGDGKVELNWSAPANDGGADIARYEVRRAAGANVAGDTAWTAVGLVTTHTVSNLTNGTAYAFEVRAVSDATAGEAAATTATPATVPGLPQSLGATPGDGEVVLTWQAPASNGGSAVTGYEYRHAEGATVPSETAWQSAGTSLTATIGSLTNGTEYAFEVRAANDEGEGEAATATVTPAVQPTVPSVPQSLAATPGDGEVVLTWQVPASNGGSAVTGYEYRHAEGATVPSETAWQSAGTSLTATIGSLTNGTEYAFEVRAVNDAGEGVPAAAMATPAVQPTAPLAPQSLAATPGDGEVVLTWQAPASNGGSAVTGYEYRHAEGASVPEETAWQSAGTSLTATVDSLTNGTEYAFEVRAANDAGEGVPAAAMATPAVQPTAPLAPQSLAATPGDGEVVLTWQAPASNGGSAVTGYEYRHAEGASVPEETVWSSAGTSLTATIGSLTNGTEYAFEVRAVNDAGEGVPAAAMATPAVQPTAPLAPQSLAATPGDGEVVLTWQAPASNGGSAVTGYEYRHAEGASVPEETAWQSAGTSLTATVDSLTNGTEYAFEVRAANDEGEGEPVATTATPAVQPTVPSVPQSLAATPGDGEVVLTWQAPASNGGSAVTGYEYRHAEGASVPEETVWSSAGTSLTATIGSLTNGTEYAFEVRAVNDAGEGVPAAAMATPAVQPTAPLAPQSLAATPGDGEVVLTWQVPASNGGSAVTGYEYRHAEGASVPEETVWSSAGTSLTATIGSLTNGTEYAFEVRAANDEGEGEAAATTATPVTVPGLPQSLAAAPGDGEVVLTWQAPANNGGSPVTGYEYRHAEGTTVPAETAWQSAGTSLTATVSGLANGTGYAFEVRAIGDAGEGAIASVTAAPATASDAPQDLAAAPGDGKVVLTWQAPANDGGSPVTGYEYRHAEGASVPEETAWASAGTSLTATVSGLANGTRYAFEVRAVSDAGQGTEASVTTVPATVPDAPQSLVATPGDGEVVLTWQPPARDGGSPVAGYEYRHAEGASVPEETAWASAGTSLTATVSGLANGTRYAFEVRAVSDAGQGAEASVTTVPATVPDAPQSLVATPGDGEVVLTWQAPANDGGSPVTGYEYRHAEGVSVPEETAWASAGLELTATVNELGDGVGYTFQVRAESEVGHGDWAEANATVLLPPYLTVADAEAQEQADAAIDFTVVLSRGSTRAVTVDYTTADGSAKAGEDYERTAGTLVFAAGDTEKTVSVPLLKDAKDEGEETLAFVLSNARHARIERAQATGTIANDNDAMPGAWLVRFGRTVAQQVVDAVGSRLEGSPRPHMTIGGVPVGTPSSTGASGPERISPLPGDEDRTLGASRRLLPPGSSFHFSSGEAGERPVLSAWGRMATGGFDAHVGNVRMDGDVTTGLLGADTDLGRLLVGAAVARSDGRGAFSLSDARRSNRARGKIRSTLTGVYPYIRLRPGETISLWGLAGMGRGRLTLTEEGGTPIRTDTSLAMGAVGARRTLSAVPETGGIALSLRSDAFWVRTSSDAVRSPVTGNLAASKGEATRMRLALHGERHFALADGGTVAPSLSFGVRRDGGDAETGFGMEVGGGLLWSDPVHGLSASVEARQLVAHEARGFRDRGISGSLRFDPTPSSARGLALSLRSSAGDPTGSGAGTLDTPSTIAELSERGADASNGRMAVEAAYGRPVLGGKFAGSPYVGFGLSGTRRDYTIGWRLEAARQERAALAFAVAGTRYEYDGGEKPEHGIAATLSLRW